MEHRWGQRVTLEVPVRLLLAGRVLGRGILRNASISGALIETPLELPLFTNLVVALPTTSELTASTQELAACVVRRAPAGLAVEWRDMACPAIVALLERITGRRAAGLLVDAAFTRSGAC
jgi:PilZ domain-containing protein